MLPDPRTPGNDQGLLQADREVQVITNKQIKSHASPSG